MHRYAFRAGMLPLLCVAGAFAQTDGAPQPLPDYIAELHAMSQESQPPGDNGWTLLMEAAALHREIIERHYDPGFAYHHQGLVDYTLLWDTEHLWEEYTPESQLPRIEEQIADARESGLLDMLARLAAHDNLVQPPDGVALIHRELPSLGAARAFARLNAARIVLAAGAGDEEEFAAAFDESIWLARHVPRSSPALISELVGIAVESLTLERTRDAIVARRVSPELARRLLDRLGRDPAMIPFATSLAAEQVMRLDTFARLYTDDGSGDGRIVPGRMDALNAEDPELVVFDAPAPGPGSTTYATKKQMIARDAEIQEMLLGAAAATPQDRRDIDAHLQEELASGWKFTTRGQTNLLLKILVSASDRSTMSRDDYALYLAATRTMLALELARARDGALPPDLASLVPGILHELPTDPYTRAPLIYRLAPDAPLGYMLYSAGFDESDDGAHVSPELRYPIGALRPIGKGSDFIFAPAE